MGIKVKRTLGTRIHNIAEELNLPKVTVEQVVRRYLEGLEESVQKGENIVIDNIVSIKVIQSTVGDITLRGRVSPALKARVSTKVEVEEEED